MQSSANSWAVDRQRRDPGHKGLGLWWRFRRPMVNHPSTGLGDGIKIKINEDGDGVRHTERGLQLTIQRTN